MAALQIDPTAIAKARESGYSDTEVADFLAQKAPEQFKGARDAGYSDKEILDHFTAKPSGVVAGLAHGISEEAKGVSSTLGLAGVHSDTVDAVGTHAAPKDYKSAPLIREGGHFYNPSDWQLGNLPQNIAEQAPGLATDLTAAKVGSTAGGIVGGLKGKAIGGTGGFLGSMLLRTFGQGAHENAAARTGDANAPVTGSDIAREAVKQAVEAPINATAAGRFLPSKVAGVGVEGVGNALKKYLATAGVETAAGGARDAANQAFTNAGQEHGVPFDANRAAEAAVTSGATGAGMVTPRLAADAKLATKFRNFGGDNAEAATALANRQIEAADGQKLISTFGNTKNARDAVAAAHSDVHNELSTASKGLTLDTENANTLKRVKNGSSASDGELSALADQAPPDVVHLARQAMLSSKLKSMGEFGDNKFNGGLSGWMEQKLRPLYNPLATGASALAATVGAGPISGMIGMSAPHALAAVYGSYAAARALDKLSGARSPAQGFTDKFGDPSVPIRTPEAPAAPQPPVTTSVPQVSAPQDTALWGSTAAPTPTLAKTLTANAKIDEGMAKITKRLGDDKRKAMIAEAMPSISALAKTQQAPAAADVPAPEPTFSPNPTALSMLKAKLKAGLPPEPQAAPAPVAPEPPAPVISPIAKKMLMEKLKQGLPPAPATPAAPTAPVAAPAPPAAPAPQPPINSIGELLQRMKVRDAQVAAGPQPSPQMAPPAPTAQPIAPAMPQAPLIAKISKKLAGNVETTPHPEADQPFTPLPPEALYRKKMTDEEMVAHEFANYKPSKKDAYGAKAVANRDANREDTMGATADHTAGDRAVAQALYHELDHAHTPTRARQAIEHFTAMMSPDAAAAVREKFTPEVIAFRWKEPKKK